MNTCRRRKQPPPPPFSHLYSCVQARKLRLYKKKQAEFDVARKILMKEQRDDMRRRQESFKAARLKV